MGQGVKNDPKALLKATSMAEKAAQFVLDTHAAKSEEKVAA